MDDVVPGDREIPPGDVTWRDEALGRIARGLDVPDELQGSVGGDHWSRSDAWIGPPPRGDGTVFGIRRDESGTDENHFDVFVEHWEGPVFVATGGFCAPLAPMYDFGSMVSDGWPRRFHLFPRAERVWGLVREVRAETRYRTSRAWRMIRHGRIDHEGDW